MGCTCEPTGDPEGASIPVRRRREPRALARTAGHGLTRGLASALGGALVAGLVRWWHQG